MVLIDFKNEGWYFYFFWFMPSNYKELFHKKNILLTSLWHVSLNLHVYERFPSSHILLWAIVLLLSILNLLTQMLQIFMSILVQAVDMITYAILYCLKPKLQFCYNYNIQGSLLPHAVLDWYSSFSLTPSMINGVHRGTLSALILLFIWSFPWAIRSMNLL